MLGEYCMSTWLREPPPRLAMLIIQQLYALLNIVTLPAPAVRLSIERSSIPTLCAKVVAHQAPGLWAEFQLGMYSPWAIVTVFPLIAVTIACCICAWLPPRPPPEACPSELQVAPVVPQIKMSPGSEEGSC